MPSPEGVWGLHVVVQPPHARFTCRCGYAAVERRSADLVRVFVEEIQEAHRAVCKGKEQE